MTVTTNIHDALSQGKAYAQQPQGSFTSPAGMTTVQPRHRNAPHPFAGKTRGESVADQVKHILADRSQFLGLYQSARVMADRCARIRTFYLELSLLGTPIADVTTLGLRHAKLLLANWRSKGLSRKTIYNRWSTLRTWAVTINKHGMLGPIEELWPDFHTAKLNTNPARELTAEQLKTRSDWLKLKSDKTAYLVDRLCREAEMTREDALCVERVQALAITKGQTFIRCGQGASAHVYTKVSEHWDLFREVVEFLAGRNRVVLAWPALEIKDAITKYALCMSYTTTTLFPKTKAKTTATATTATTAGIKAEGFAQGNATGNAA